MSRAKVTDAFWKFNSGDQITIQCVNWGKEIKNKLNYKDEWRVRLGGEEFGNFLKHAYNLLKKENGKINNIDAIIICEKPKILDYSELIKENIAKILNINSKRISIKGKTSESLGFIGRQEGIAAMVNTSIKINDNMFYD